MSTSDLEKMQMGFANYGEKLKKLGVTPRENALLAYQHKIPVTVPNFLLDIAIFEAGPDIERYSGLDQGKDGFGVDWKYVPLQGAPMPIGHMLDDIADWKEIVKFPDLDAIDWKKQVDADLHTDWGGFLAGKGIVRLPNGASCMDGDKMGLCLVPNGMFERMHALMNFENALISLVSDPESCFEFFSAVADHKIKYFKKIKEYYPVDVINAHDDYGTADRMFMSLDTWRELIKPNLKRIVDATHDLGLIYQHHSCGYIEPLIPEFIEIGVDAIDPLQGSCNLNLKELKEKYGSQITFVGGCDNIAVFDNPDSTTEQIKAEYRKVADDLAPNGSFVSFHGSLSLECLPAIFAEHFDYVADMYQK